MYRIALSLLLVSSLATAAPRRIPWLGIAACASLVTTVGLAISIFREPGTPPPEKPPREQLVEQLAAHGVATPKPIRFTHVGQIHRELDVVAKDADHRAKILTTQRRVIAELRRAMATKKRVVVFLEGVEVPFTKELRDKLRAGGPSSLSIPGWNAVQSAQRFFPNGFPKDGEPLTADQEDQLMKRGGTLLLWSTGEIDTLEATDTEGIGRRLIDRVRAWRANPKRTLEEQREIEKIMHGERERHLIEILVRRFPEGTPDDMLVEVVFGDDHDLGAYSSDWLIVDKK